MVFKSFETVCRLQWKGKKKRVLDVCTINFLISFVIGFIGGIMGFTLLGTIYSLAVFIPSIAVAVRRMHDVGKSGWFILIPIYNLILACTNGESGENKFGADPKASEE